MQTVKQLADEMNVSKTAVIKKIKQLNMDLPKEGNRLIVDDESAEIIAAAFQKNRKPKTENQIENQKVCKKIENQIEVAVNEEKNENSTGKIENQTGENRKLNRKLKIENRQPNRKPMDKVCDLNDEKNDYKDEYIQHLLQTIERLEHEKEQLNVERKEQASHIMEMHKNAEKHSQQMDEMRLKLEGMEKQIALMAAAEPDEAKTVEVVQPADAAEPEKKKGFFARVFGW